MCPPADAATAASIGPTTGSLSPDGSVKYASAGLETTELYVPPPLEFGFLE